MENPGKSGITEHVARKTKRKCVKVGCVPAVFTRVSASYKVIVSFGLLKICLYLIIKYFSAYLPKLSLNDRVIP